MANNWNTTVTKINRDRYQVPEGWDTKEKIAESLKCAPERVADLLKPGIAIGEIERQEFPVWDEGRRMAVRVVCYRCVKVAVVGNGKEGRIRVAIAKYPKLSNYAISKKLSKVSAAEVAEVRGK